MSSKSRGSMKTPPCVWGKAGLTTCAVASEGCRGRERSGRREAQSPCCVSKQAASVSSSETKGKNSPCCLGPRWAITRGSECGMCRGPPITVAVVTFICSSLSQWRSKETQQNLRHHPGPALHGYLQTSASPDNPRGGVREGNPQDCTAPLPPPPGVPIADSPIMFPSESTLIICLASSFLLRQSDSLLCSPPLCWLLAFLPLVFHLACSPLLLSPRCIQLSLQY